MTFPFLIIGALTAGSAIAAMSLRNLVHCALSLVVAFVGLAALYLQLSAEFVGFVQILVYIGAVAILIVFAILLTRGTEPPTTAIATATPWAVAIAVAALVVMAGAMNKSAVLLPKAVPAPTPGQGAGPGAAAGAPGPGGLVAVESPTPTVPVKALGVRLMEDYVVPLEVMGLLLTAAMIGAVIIALPERQSASGPEGRR